MPFLKPARPEIVVVSCGPGNVFGFPHSDVLDKYRKVGTKVLGTDKYGAVTIQTDGEKIETKDYRLGDRIQAAEEKQKTR